MLDLLSSKARAQSVPIQSLIQRRMLTDHPKGCDSPVLRKFFEFVRRNEIVPLVKDSNVGYIYCLKMSRKWSVEREASIPAQ